MDGFVRTCARSPHRALFDPELSVTVSLPSRALVQTVSPQIVEFEPSADHRPTVSGVAVVNGYGLRFYSVGGSQPFHAVETGGPAPEATERSD